MPKTQRNVPNIRIYGGIAWRNTATINPTSLPTGQGKWSNWKKVLRRNGGGYTDRVSPFPQM